MSVFVRRHVAQEGLRSIPSIMLLIMAFREFKSTPNCSSSLTRMPRLVIVLRSAVRRISWMAFSRAISVG